MANEIPEEVRHLVHVNHWTKKGPDARWCAGSVHEGGRGVGFYQCSRRPTVTEHGYGWCKQHAPSAVEARRAASNAKYEADSARRGLGYKVSDARRAITEKAIDAAHQRCSIDDVFAAVGEYERLVEEQRALIADHEARGLK